MAALLLIAGMIFLRVRISYAGFDVGSSNFTFFWLAGRMELEGQNPYDPTQYLAGHETYGIKWQPNRIFPYPLPLALLFIPFGYLSLINAYLCFQVLSLVIMAASIHVLLGGWHTGAHRRLLIPLFASFFFFGPMYLTLHTGSIGAFAILTILGTIKLLEKQKSLAAGFLLSLIILKPPQGLTILLLAGVWFLARRDWQAILGMILGGLSLLIIGLVQDPWWVVKFRGASEAVMDRTLGVHSNVWAFSYLACKGASPCSTLLGGTLALVLLGLAGLFLWKNPAKVTAWEAFNVILPAAFVSTVYLWAYDQVTYIIPIVWITGILVERTKSYLPAFLFLIILDLYSLFALLQQASTDKDLWSLGTTLIVVGVSFGLLYLNRKRPIHSGVVIP